MQGDYWKQSQGNENTAIVVFYRKQILWETPSTSGRLQRNSKCSKWSKSRKRLINLAMTILWEKNADLVIGDEGACIMQSTTHFTWNIQQLIIEI